MIDIFRKNRGFFPFWLARVISLVGDGVQALAILWLSYNFYKSSLIVGIVMISVSLPGILISPFAGNLADRAKRPHIMVAADLARFVCVGVLAFLSYEQALTLTSLIILSVVISLASAYFNPSAMAFLPQVVRREDVTRANALTQISSNVSMILGPLVGMSLIVAIGVSTAFAINSVSFLFSALLIGRIKAQFKAPPLEEKRGGIWGTLINGFRLLKRYPIASKMLDKAAVINFFYASIPIIIPIFAGGIYQSGAKGIGIMMGVFGAGMFVSSLLLSVSRLAFCSVKIKLTVALTVMGAVFVAFGMVHTLAVTLGALFVIGFTLNFTNIHLISLYQKVLPNEVLGRIMAFMTAISLSLQPLSYGLTGAFADMIGVTWVLTVSGIIIMISALRIYFIKELEVADDGQIQPV